MINMSGIIAFSSAGEALTCPTGIPKLVCFKLSSTYSPLDLFFPLSFSASPLYLQIIHVLTISPTFTASILVPGAPVSGLDLCSSPC